ncbi:unnamed protein product, partial [Rotaria sp. Silwood2]
HQFGKMFHPAVIIKNKHIDEIQKDIWEHIITKESNKNKLKNLIEKKLFSSIDKDKLLLSLSHLNLLKYHLEELINTVLNIHNNINNFKDKFKIRDNVLCAKNSDGMYSSNTFLSI